MVIVSLTTTSARVELLRITLLSLIHQTYRADKILVWVSKESYLSDDGVADITVLEDKLADVLALAEQRVEFRFTKNTGPYRKLIPALAYAGYDDLIVTADDDIFYGKAWLTDLVACYEREQRPVVARARRIRRTPWGSLKGYFSWPLVRKSGKHDEDILITFGGGAVLKREFFPDDICTNESYLEIAPTTDDIWFSFMLKDVHPTIHVAAEIGSQLYFIEHPRGLFDNYNMKKDKQNKLLKLISRIWLSIKLRLGIPHYNNDYCYRAVGAYFAKRNRQNKD